MTQGIDDRERDHDQERDRDHDQDRDRDRDRRRDGERDPAPRTRKSWFFLAVVGWAETSMGFLLAMLPFWLAGSLERGSSPWLVALTALCSLISLVYAIDLSRNAGKHLTARMRASLRSRQPQEDRGYVLYLRPFGVDNALFRMEPAGGRNILSSLASHFAYRISPFDYTWEARLVRLFERFGSVHAVGRPDEPYPLPGARRFYLPRAGEGWKEEVAQHIRRARLVVLVAAAGRDSARAAGTLWEYTEAVRVLPPSRLVLVVGDGREAYHRFRSGAAAYFAQREAELRPTGKTLPPAPVLPDHPRRSRPQKLKDSFPVRGVVRFDDDWTARLTPFDPTAEPGPTQHARWRSALRTQVRPLLDEVERSLPGRIVRPLTFRWHWQVIALLLAGLGLLAQQCAANWDRFLISERIALIPVLASIVLPAIRLGSLMRGMGRDAVEVLLPDDGEGEPREPNPFAGQRTLARLVWRWPGPFGLRVWVAEWHRDETGAYEDALDRRAPWRPRHWRTQWIGSETLERWPRGISIRADILRVVERERAVGQTHRSLTVRGVTRLLGAGTVLAFVVLWTVRGQLTGPLVPYAAVLVPWSALDALAGVRDFRQAAQIRRRPRPADLRRQPTVLYLRPRGEDPLPLSVWRWPLDHDIRTVFRATGLLRIACDPGESPPPPRLARLPLPEDDWQAPLAAALPLAHLVLVPACGTAPETLRQLTEAVRLVPPSRLLLVLPAGEGAAESYDAFRAAAAEVLPGLPLPALPPPSVPDDHLEPALRGVIHFAGDQGSAVLTFRPVETPEPSRHEQLLRIRDELLPLLTRLSQASEQPVPPS
ncbi:hypothetical protein ABZ614_04690 [Streptomyces sp. NPDC013178]|uniref:hypothetical protein n=1 Tax=unclassified Streptomyces TaxID=2593676 RepID=UPI0033C83F22